MYLGILKRQEKFLWEFFKRQTKSMLSTSVRHFFVNQCVEPVHWEEMCSATLGEMSDHPQSMSLEDS